MDPKLHVEADGSGAAALGWPDVERCLRTAVARCIEDALGRPVEVGTVRFFAGEGSELTGPEPAAVVVAGFSVPGLVKP